MSAHIDPSPGRAARRTATRTAACLLVAVGAVLCCPAPGLRAAPGAAPPEVSVATNARVPAPSPTNLPPVEDERSVVVLPVLDLSGASGRVAQHATALLEEGLARYARLQVMRGEQVIERLKAQPAYAEKLGFAREFARLGRQDYERLRLAEAAKHLQLAAQTYRSVHHELVAPREVAQTLLTLAKTHLEQGAEGPAERAFQQLLSVDPSVRLAPGRFAQSVIEVFDKARYHTARNPVAGISAETALAIGREFGADYVVTGHLRPRPEPGSLALGVWLRDVKRQVPVTKLQRVPADDPISLIGHLDRLTSRLAACVPNRSYLAWQRNPDRFEPALFVDTSFQHGTHLKHPLQSGFHELGLSAGALWTPQRHLIVLGRFGFTAARNNRPYEDLLEELQLLRLLLGAGAGVVGRRGGVYSVVAFDLALNLPFSWTSEADCKWHQPPPSACAEQLQHADAALAFGVHAGAGAHWNFAAPLFLRIRAGLTYYLVEPEQTQLNLAVDWEAGLGYRF